MPDLLLLEDQFLHSINYIKMLIRDLRIDEASQMIEELESQSATYLDQFPPGVRYLIPFARSRVHLQLNQMEQAKAELEKASQLAGEDEDAQARIQNLLGVVYFKLSQAAKALQCHLISVRAINNGVIKDMNLQLSIYQNLANAYWSLDLPKQAVTVYKKALKLTRDLNDPNKQGALYWGLASAYKAMNVKRYALLYMARAIKVYQATGDTIAEATMTTNLAEVFIEENRLSEAAATLDRVRSLIDGTNKYGLWSFLYRYYADLARKQGDLPAALQHAEDAIRQAELLLQHGQIEIYIWVDPHRAYAEALQGAAFVREELGEPDVADTLFQRALEQLEQTTDEETRRAIHLNYGAILEARGDYKRAAQHYKRAANRPNISA